LNDGPTAWNAAMPTPDADAGAGWETNSVMTLSRRDDE
jgi:hypothetical protein